MPLNLNYPQHDFYSMEKPFRAFVGGYRSGKTFLGSMRLCVLALEYPGIKLGYFAPTYPQIADIFYSTIADVAELMDMTAEIKTSSKEVSLYFHGELHAVIKCRSMDCPERIVGFDINHALVDEIDCMKRNKADAAWKKIVARLSSSGFDEQRIYDEDMSAELVIEALEENTVDFTTTPEGFNWVYDLFVTKLSDDEALQQYYGIVHASTRQNAKNLPDDYIDKLYATYTEELVNAYVEGQFVNLTSGTIYKSYNRVKCGSKETVAAGDTLRIGMDFNVTKMAATVWVLRGKEWHAVSELVDLYDTPEMIKTIESKWPDHKVIIYPDASGKNRKTVKASESDISLLRDAGFEVRVRNTNPSVKDRINATNKAFESGVAFVNEQECPTTARCLEQQTYGNNGEPDKTSGNDHQNDATTYPLAYELPIIKPITNINYRMSY